MMSMKGKSLELVPRRSSALVKVARNWLESLSPKRLFRSIEAEWTLLLMEYIELAYDMP